MMQLGPVSYLAATFIQSPQLVQHVDKVYQLAMYYFTLSQSLFFCAFGIKEICFDAKLKRANPDNLFNRTLGTPTTLGNFSVGHGLFFLGAGACGLGMAAHQMHYADLARYSWPLDIGCKAFFIFANLIALEYNLGLLFESCLFDPSEESQIQARRLQQSALAGIFSSLCYITATALSLFGNATAIALVVGVIGACFGCYKILYDFFLLHKSTIKS